MEVYFCFHGKNFLSACSLHIDIVDLLSFLIYEMSMLYYQLQTFLILSSVNQLHMKNAVEP